MAKRYIHQPINSDDQEIRLVTITKQIAENAGDTAEVHVSIEYTKLKDT
jgi:hypothetical protein